jgi:hypothetical protein
MPKNRTQANTAPPAAGYQRFSGFFGPPSVEAVDVLRAVVAKLAVTLPDVAPEAIVTLGTAHAG